MTRPPAPPRETDRPLPDRVTMPLLALVGHDSMDQDYADVARRRAEPPQKVGLRGVAVVTAVFGLMIALAAVQTARNADVNEASRGALLDRIDTRKSEVETLEDRIAELRVQLSELEETGARVRGQLAGQRISLAALQNSTGFVAVQGPGLRITVSDDPDGSEDGRVRASDLRRLVNSLWWGGAQAIAINGRRLTAVSPITQVGISVSVNRGPLSPPYVVTAIGPESMSSSQRASTSGVLFDSLAEQFGFGVQRVAESEVQLPAASPSLLRLRYAERPATNQDAPDNEED